MSVRPGAGERPLERAAPVKPAPFGYHRATSVEDAVRLLEAYEGTARVLAGGQSLVPMMNMRLIRPDALVDLRGVRELDEVHAEGDGTVVGALVRYARLERDPLVADRLALLARVVRHVGDRQVRNRGTVGGSLAQGDPTGEIPLAALVLGAAVHLFGRSGARSLPVAELYAGSYETTIEPCEVLTTVSFPWQPGHVAFAEVCRRHNDFAVVSVAAAGDRRDDGTWSRVRLGLGGVAPTPVLVPAAGELLSDSTMDDAAIAAAGELAAEVCDPASDVRASAEYRLHLVPVYVRRVLSELRSNGESEGSGAFRKESA